MAAFEYRQAEEIRRAFARHGVRYLFLGLKQAHWGPKLGAGRFFAER